MRCGGSDLSLVEVDTLRVLLILFCICPTLFSLSWVVVSEYRASLQRRMNPKQEECTFESPLLLDAGGKGSLLDSTPAPTPTEVSAWTISKSWLQADGGLPLTYLFLLHSSQIGFCPPASQA